MRYEYVEVHINRFLGAGSKEHRRLIDEYAAKGYRYVGFIPVNMTDYGKTGQQHLKFCQKEI